MRRSTVLSGLVLQVALSMILVNVILPAAPGEQGYSAVTFDAGPSYPNTDIINLWTVHNQSEGGYDYPYELDSPALGMEFYGTSSLIVGKAIGLDYSWEDLADAGLFPAEAEIYVPIDNYANGGVAWATQVADNAVTNPRIKGAWVNDAVSGWESGANMSAIYTALHHEDEHLEAPLLLGLVIYERDYFVQSPNTWDDVDDYIDFIQFWYFPDSYGAIYANFAGYEDSFHDMKTMLPTQEFWIGVYLHFYSDGSYPIDFTYRQMSLACKWIADGEASKLTILSDYWISNEPESSWLVRNFVNSELTPDYSTTWNVTSGAVTSYQGVQAVSSDFISDCSTLRANNYTFVSQHLQNVTVSGMAGSHIKVRNMRTGETYDTFAGSSGASFMAEPREKYLVLDLPLTTVTYDTRQYIETQTSWDNKEVFLNSVLNVNSTLYVNNSIVHVGSNHYTDSTKNGTNPQWGIILNQTNTCKIRVLNSVIEPLLRDFPFYFNTSWSASGTSKVIELQGSWVSCYAGLIKPMGYTWWNNTVIYSAMPNGGSQIGLNCNFGSVAYEAKFRNVTVWNYRTPGTVGMFLMPCNLHASGALVLDNVTLAGGAIGLYLDMQFSTSPMTLRNVVIYDTANGDLTHIGTYTRARIDNGDPSKIVTVTTKFILQTDTALTGALKNAAAGTIGSYTSSGGSIARYEIPDLSMSTTITQTNPYPWTFTVSSGFTSAYYYMAEDKSIWTNKSYSWDYPRHLSFNQSIVSILPGMQTEMVVDRVDLQLYQGVSISVSSTHAMSLPQSFLASSSFDYSSFSWTLEPIWCTVTSGTANVLVNLYDPAASSKVLSLNASATTGTVDFYVDGLLVGMTHSVYVDSVGVAQLVADAGGMITWSYSVWSTHTFDVYVPQTYPEDDDDEVYDDDRSPASSTVGSTSFSWTSLSMVALGSVSVIIIVLFLSRIRRRSGRRYR